MTAPPAPSTRSPLPPARDEEVGLAALLDLCGQDDDDGVLPSVPPRPSLRDTADHLRDALAALRNRARYWAQLGAAWGAGPGGAWRAW